MKNVADESYRENQNTHFVLSNLFFFLENLAVCEIIWKKYYKSGQTTDDNMAHVGYLRL